MHDAYNKGFKVCESESGRRPAVADVLIATGCDEAYLRTWSAALNLTDMLTRVLP